MTTTTPTLSPAAPRRPLPLERLYSHCDPAQLPFDSSAELEPLAAHLGQDRAVQALEFGLQIPHEGYNIFLLGSTGVGKRELLDGVLGGLLTNAAGPRRAEPSDWCYVNNFESPDRPVALRLPRGKGCQLREDLSRAVEELLGVLPSTFQSDEYQARVQELGEQYQE
nr:AAA family ATPase [Halioglobus sp.]